MFTVVIPTHNRGQDLIKALGSVFRQTYRPSEVVLVDDGSAPAVSENVFEGAPDDMICRILRHGKAKGASSARNAGVRAASHEWIAFLDDDDEFKVDKLEVVAGEIHANPDVDVFFHPAEIHMVKESIVYISRPSLPSGEDVFRSLLVTNRVGGTPMVVVRRSSVVQVGLFDEGLPALEDYELWLRLAKEGCVFRLIDRPLTKYHYVTRKKSVSKGIEANNAALELIEAKYPLEYKSLSRAEKRSFEDWKAKMSIHKALLNGQHGVALGKQFRLFLRHPRPSSLLAAIAILLGPKFVYKLKATLG